MADPSDVQALRVARREFERRGIDTSRASVYVMHGVCYVRGAVSVTRGSRVADLDIEMRHIARLLKQRPEIRDVVLEVTCS